MSKIHSAHLTVSRYHTLDGWHRDPINWWIVATVAVLALIGFSLGVHHLGR